LLVNSTRCKGMNPQETFAKTQTERNMVKEMICELRAVKPRREPRRELQPQLNVEIVAVD
ncbi:MAG: hypothetical protein ACREJM_04410, partial [Candidatus Saccharimonadales bacterium]